MTMERGETKPLFGLRISSLTALNITQFLGALNDNIFKLLIGYFLIDIHGIASTQKILAGAGGVFVIPFLLFLSSAGTLADRFSKSRIIVFTKALEVFIVAFAIWTFTLNSTIASFIVLFFMATQSAIFGPSKYGIIPEIVEQENISKANGLLTSFTFLACIIGTFFASFLTQITGRNFILTSIFCLGISVLGLASSFLIRKTPSAGSEKKFTPWFFWDVYQTIRKVSAEPSLVAAIFASAFFLFLGAFFQLNMIPYAIHALGLSDIEGGYLFLVTALGIGIGSVVAGYISGKQVELGLVPIGALGVIFNCFFIDAVGDNLYFVIPIVFFMGFFGGIYVVPLDSFIQFSSPNILRGQVVAAANFLSFVGVFLASLLLFFLSEVLDVPPNTGFSILGGITLVVIALFSYQFYDYLARFVAMTISRLRFSMEIFGSDGAADHPVVYLSEYKAWNDSLLFMGSQRRRMRIFVDAEQEAVRPWLKFLYRLLRIVFIPEVESIHRNAKCAKKITKWLSKGFSICILIEPERFDVESARLAEFFRTFITDVDYSLIPVTIHKGEKEKHARFFARASRIFRTPAEVTFHSPILSERIESNAQID
ncbi:MAG: MFS transporter [Chlamydiia bacterium]|nr:MFS transporter [Chlamydiia bacterium]